MNVWWTIVGMLVVVGFALLPACTGRSTHPPTISPEPTIIPTPTSTPTPTIDWLTISAEDLAAAYLEDQVQADRRYQDEDLRVRGVVYAVVQPFPNVAWVMVNGVGDLWVGCYAGAFSERDSWPQGSTVTLVGVGKGRSDIVGRLERTNGTDQVVEFKTVEVGFCVAVPEGEPLPIARPSPRPTP